MNPVTKLNESLNKFRVRCKVLEESNDLLRSYNSELIDSQVELENDIEQFKDAIAILCGGCVLRATPDCDNCKFKEPALRHELWG